MNNGLIIGLLLFVSTGTWAAPQLLPFKTDYCTGYPDGTFSSPEKWKHCCLLHDLFLWAGGEEKDRVASDLELKSCVAATGEENQALVMYWGVRAASYSPVKFPDKVWNNGWRTSRPAFQKLTAEDLELISEELKSSDYKFVPVGIKNYFLKQLRSRLD